jgi:hypothetical protein
MTTVKETIQNKPGSTFLYAVSGRLVKKRKEG